MNEPDVVILDGYVDEPAQLGVPPYISTEPRILAGVCEELGLDWKYIPVDTYRKIGLPDSKILLVHGGITVPGTYLSGTPMSQREAEELGETDAETFLGGPLARYSEVYGYDHYSRKDLGAYFYDLLNGRCNDRWATLDERNRWLDLGSEVVKFHPMFPDPLIPEISTYRGCVRYFTGGCAFCSEPDYGKPEFRDQGDIIEEIQKMYDLGIRHFRHGGQSCIFSYKADGVGSSETPTPRPDELEKLLRGIREACPEIKVLHVDNANPAVIANNEEQSIEILKLLVEYTTSGNVLAFGMESADPAVIEVNNLNTKPEEVEKAVKMVNEIGRERGENGMPKLLPGLNFLGGLKGESPKSYLLNYEFLEKILNQGLLLRRINIRQVLSSEERFELKYKKEFRQFKKKVREEIDGEMLTLVVPKGTVLRDVYMEKKEGSITFGRQVGTYPLLIGVEYPLELGRYYDVIITDHGYRSVTGIHHPFYLNEVGYRELQAVPGIGKKRAAAIFRKRPEDKEELRKIVEDDTVLDTILCFTSFK
ncbi:MAG: radical SAM protein [Thermoplasmata archaeon]